MNKRIALLCILTVFLTFTFSIPLRVQKVEASETIYIRADGSIDPPTALISTIDNITYTFVGNINDSIVVERNNTVIDGAGYTLQGTGSGTGIELTGITNVTIKNTEIRTFSNGVCLYSSSGNNVSRNNIASSYYGVLINSSGNSLSDNNITASKSAGVGVFLNYSSGNSVHSNNIANNGFGVYVYFSSGNNVSGNNITGNNLGVVLADSSNNSIFHNNFFTNWVQAVTAGSSTNIWDGGYPYGGNYWSNYTGADLYNGPLQNLTGSDGIGDSPHIIDANNTDYHPLMGILYSFNVSWIDSGYIVDLISNSSVSAFDIGFWIEHPEVRVIKFNVTGETSTAGFCRICIPKALLNASYTVLLNGTEIPFALLPCSSSTHSYLYFNYTHSTQEVIIIPEFPSFLILPLSMITMLLASLVCRRKKQRATSFS